MKKGILSANSFTSGICQPYSSHHIPCSTLYTAANVPQKKNSTVEKCLQGQIKKATAYFITETLKALKSENISWLIV